ncbi:mCG146953 [Mus musculus]|nr:mCG146953 [Mus musculus]
MAWHFDSRLTHHPSHCSSYSLPASLYPVSAARS